MKTGKLKTKALVLAICVLFLAAMSAVCIASNAAYSVPIGTGAVDFADNNLASAYSREFATGYTASVAGWSEDIRLTSDSAYSGFPAIAVDTNNNVHIIWYDGRDGNYEIYYTKLDNTGTTLVDDTRLTTTTDSAVSYGPTIAVDTNNNVHITWCDTGDGNYEIYYTKLDNTGTTLVDDTRLTPADSAWYSWNPAIAVDTNNNVHITWYDTRDGNYEIYYTKLDNTGTTLVDDTRLTPADSAVSYSPTIAVDTNNNVHIIWNDYRDGNFEIYYTKLDNTGTTLVDDTRLTTTTDSAYSGFPAIAVDTNNNVHITWCDTGDGNYEIYYTKLDNNGTTLVDDTRLTPADSAWYSWNPAIAMDTNNNVHITWNDYRDGKSEIYYTKLDNNGTTLVDDTRLTPAEFAHSKRPAIAVDTNNNVHITWFDERDGNFEIYYKHSIAPELLVTILSPSANFSVEQGTPTTITATVVDSSTGAKVNASLVQATFSNGDNPVILTDAGAVYSGTWTPQNIGLCTITVTATHSTLGSGSDSVSGNISTEQDTEPPTTIDDTPAGWQNSSFIISLTASDTRSGVAATYYRVDGGAWQAGTTISITTDGNHTVEYYSVDNAGNVESAHTVYAKLDTEPPTTTDDTPAGWQNSFFIVTLTASDTCSGAAATYYRVDGSAWQTGTEISINTDGNHSIEFYSVDNAGNVESAHTVYAKLDTEPPTTTADTPAGWQNSFFIVTLTASDTCSGVAYTYYRVDGSAWQTGTEISINTDGNHSIEFYSVDNAGNIESTHTVYAKLSITPTCNVSGTVFDQNGSEISGASVSLINSTYMKTAVTDSTGTFLFVDVYAGDYTIQASADGYQYNATIINVSATQPNVVNLYLERNGAVSGTVTNSVNGSVISSAKVVLSAISGITQETVTDSNGNYLFEDVTPANYSLTVSALYYQTKSSHVVVVTGKTSLVDIALMPYGVVQGTVTNTSGMALADVDVVLSREGVLLMLTTTTDANGQFSFVNVAPGDYNIQASLTGFVINSTNVKLTTGTTTTDLVLARLPTVSGRIVSADGTPISGALVRVLSGTGVVAGSNYSDSNGIYTVFVSKSSYYEVVVSATGYQQNSSFVRVDADSISYLDFVLSPNGVVIGAILDILSGLPIPNATVMIEKEGYLDVNTTNSTGVYSFTDLIPDEYIVSAYANGYAHNTTLISVTSGYTTSANIYLSPAGSIKGTVLSTGLVLNGAFVALIDETGRYLKLNRTDSNGSFLIVDAPPGDYKLKAFLNGYQQNSTPVTITAYNTSTIDFSLIPNELYVYIDVGTIFSRGETIDVNVTVLDTSGNYVTNIKDISLVLQNLNETIPISVQKNGVAYRGTYKLPSNISIGVWMVKANVTDTFGNIGEDVLFINIAESYFIRAQSASPAYTLADNAAFYAMVARYSNLSDLLTEEDVNVTLQIIDENNISLKSCALTTMQNSSVFYCSITTLNDFGLGNYTAMFTVDDGSGNVMYEPLTFKIVNNFSVSAHTDSNYYNRNNPVRIFGRVLYENNNPVDNTTVTINVYAPDFIRTYYAATNSTGYYEYLFKPFKCESGSYIAESVVVSNDLERRANATFTIFGLFAPSEVNVDMSKNSNRSIDIPIKNIGDISFTGIDVNIIDSVADDHIDINLDDAPSSLLAGESGVFTVSIRADANAANKASFKFAVTTHQDASELGYINVSSHDAVPVVKLSQYIIDVGINPNQSNAITKTINITNAGYGVLKDVHISQPEYNWLLSTANDLGDIEPGKSRVFDINIQPTNDTLFGIYNDEIKIISSNYQPISIYLTIQVTSSQNGSLLFHVKDDIGDEVSDALININNQQVYTQFFSGTTNSSGYYQFNSIPTGRYSYRVNADGHGTVSGTVVIEPKEKPTLVEVILPVSIMDVVFEVTPIKIEDKYFITLNLTFETDVRPPILLPVPSYLKYNVDRIEVATNGYEGTAWVTIHNTGSISVKDVTVDSSQINVHGYTIAFLGHNSQVLEIEEIAAKSSISIPCILHIDQGTAMQLRTDFLGSIKIQGSYLYFERNSDVTRTAITKAEIPVFVHEIGKRELIVEPEIIVKVVPEEYYLTTYRPFYSPAVGFIPDVFITNGCDIEDVYIFQQALGLAVKYKPSIYIDMAALVGTGNVLSAVGIIGYIVDGTILPYDTFYEQYKEIPDMKVGVPNLAEIDLTLYSDVEKIFLKKYMMVQKGLWLNLESDESAVLLSDGWPLSTKFINLFKVRLNLPGPEVTTGAVGFLYEWQYDETSRIKVIPILLINPDMPEITIPSPDSVCYNCWDIIDYPYTPPHIDYPDMPVIPIPPIHIVENVHERVTLQISQEATLERDAFAASLKMYSKLSNDTIDNVSATLLIKYENGTDATDWFYIHTVKSLNLSSIKPLGVSAVEWTIIPIPGAGGINSSGNLYYVQAIITYTVNGIPFELNTTEEQIIVKPQPKLTLDYYIPTTVKAYTPFKLAVKVTNNGYGSAKNFKIDSAQPRIIDNQAGLLINFNLIGSAVAGEPCNPSLKINFGDIEPGESRIAYWNMITSRDGRFTAFEASYTHSDALGGESTSLITGVNTHILVREIIDDSPYQDLTFDFLVDSNRDGIPDSILDSVSGDEKPVASVDYTAYKEYTLDSPNLIIKTGKSDGWIYLDVEDPTGGTQMVKKIVRLDGKVLDTRNYYTASAKIYIIDDPETMYTIMFNTSQSIPCIISYAPQSHVSDMEGATRTFSITVDQTVNLSWFINGTEVQKDTSVTSASYTNTSAVVGVWSVSAIATNANGTDIQVWVWIVSSSTTLPVRNFDTGEDFATIQSAIDDLDTKEGHTITVDAGIYYENVVVNKRLTLRGIGMPVVDAGGSDNAITLSADGITLEGFIVTNSSSHPDAGIKVVSSNNTITGNTVSNNSDNGIYLDSSCNNKIYLNNFINNRDNVYYYKSNNIWNSTKKIGYVYNGNDYENYLGNYWSDYTGSDADNDGIGDTPYSIDSDKDNYPLMAPWEKYFARSVFDTGTGTYPSLMGTHTGTITPSVDIKVSKLYTYPCAGTGGHTESFRLYENGTLIANGAWNGYQSDGHNITINPSVILQAGHTYNYTIVTGSYPQILHTTSKELTGGTITCSSFVDANGNIYTDWIPAIRLG